MEHIDLPAAGWYAAPHANGEQRYWDGTAWHEPAQAEPTTPFMKKAVTRRTGAIVAGATLVLGLVIGGAASGAGTQAELGALKSEVSSLQSDVAEAQAAAEESVDTLASAKAASDTMTKERDSAKARVAELEAAATAAQAELDARAATIADLQGKVKAQDAAPPVVEAAAPAAPKSVYYKNCTAAREAGAAPVRRGDPGYGSHLDRDGDGIGCE
ncbi:excalibur calcium-binding domain-containing protein [Microbacterium testaceum]|uniref:excalibur calcium-binding domain-containing protein n=1 Tax=Microbacterium testaceum TaxID=2033 RepID=UPI0034157712